MGTLLRAAVVVAAAPGVLALSVVANRFDARADCLPYVGIGTTSTYAIRSDGTLWRYGDIEGNPLLVDVAEENETVYPLLQPIDRVTQVSAIRHTLALRDGVVWSWGHDDEGKLGDGVPDVQDYQSRPFPLPVVGVPAAKDVSAGSFHSLALSQAGRVWAWGRGAEGQLGDGLRTTHGTPVEVSSLSGVVDVDGGRYHTLAVKSDGTVWAWGENSSRQLGDGTTTDRTVPTRVLQVTGAIAVEGTVSNSLALKSDGTVWQWGSGFVNGPAQVPGLSGILAIAGSANGSHWMALKNDGSVWTWGNNNSGQVGDGTITTRSTPYKVLGLPAITKISAGGEHSVALAANGEIWTWGYNYTAYLGDGTRTNRHTPVRTLNNAQCFAPDLAPSPPAPTVSPVPTPSVSPPAVGEEAPVAECRFARFQGQIVYGGYALVSHTPPPVSTTIKCSISSGGVYKERAASAPGPVAAVADAVEASPAEVTICTYAEAVYPENHIVTTSSCQEA
jgi:alpha-tubulin suppressor-like RCC1 family protein